MDPSEELNGTGLLREGDSPAGESESRQGRMRRRAVSRGVEDEVGADVACAAMRSAWRTLWIDVIFAAGFNR